MKPSRARPGAQQLCSAEKCLLHIFPTCLSYMSALAQACCPTIVFHSNTNVCHSISNAFHSNTNVSFHNNCVPHKHKCVPLNLKCVPLKHKCGLFTTIVFHTNTNVCHSNTCVVSLRRGAGIVFFVFFLLKVSGGPGGAGRVF